MYYACFSLSLFLSFSLVFPILLLLLLFFLTLLLLLLFQFTRLFYFVSFL